MPSSTRAPGLANGGGLGASGTGSASDEVRVVRDSDTSTSGTTASDSVMTLASREGEACSELTDGER